MQSHRLLIGATLLALSTSMAYAQNEATTETNSKPKTKLESFMSQDGVVIVQGFTTVGSVDGMFNSSVTVDSKEIFDAASGKKEYGITVEVKKGVTTGLTRENTSYIDYEEIESMLKGIDYISKVDKSSTTLSNFQANYSTKDDLSFAVFNSATNLGSLWGSKNANNIYFNVRSGDIVRAVATFKIEDLPKVRDLFVKAKQSLDAIKSR